MEGTVKNSVRANVSEGKKKVWLIPPCLLWHWACSGLSGALQVYRGYVDDPRNTDNAWMETEAVNYHDETGKYLQVCS